MNAEQLLNAAVERIESASIKAWATSDHNRPIFLKLAQNALDKYPEALPVTFATYITLLAMGA